MINWERYKLNIQLLLDNKEKLLRFSDCLNQNAIKILWANDPSDKEDYKMADHMIKRFAVFSNDPASFFSGTPCIQNRLNYGFNLNIDPDHAFFMMEFFKYIKYSLGEYHIEMMFGFDYIKLWKEYDSIHFFYLLTEEMQLTLLEKYNTIYDGM